MNEKIYIIIIVALITLNIYFYMKSEKEERQPDHKNIQQPVANPVNNSVSTQPLQTTVTLYYSPSCGHCVRLKKNGEWNKFLTGIENKNIKVNEVNCQTEECDGISGVPFIIKTTPNGVTSVYNGNRTGEDLIAWTLQN
jgi:hypothetical protein